MIDGQQFNPPPDTTYVIKLVRDLRQVSGFLWVLRFPPILLKVALNTITLTQLPSTIQQILN